MPRKVLKLRLCPSQDKKVVCDGLCNVVFDDDAVHICSMREKALDMALNARARCSNP